MPAKSTQTRRKSKSTHPEAKRRIDKALKGVKKTRRRSKLKSDISSLPQHAIDVINYTVDTIVTNAVDKVPPHILIMTPFSDFPGLGLRPGDAIPFKKVFKALTTVGRSVLRCSYAAGLLFLNILNTILKELVKKIRQWTSVRAVEKALYYLLLYSQLYIALLPVEDLPRTPDRPYMGQPEPRYIIEVCKDIKEHIDDMDEELQKWSELNTELASQGVEQQRERIKAVQGGLEDYIRENQQETVRSSSSLSRSGSRALSDRNAEGQAGGNMIDKASEFEQGIMALQGYTCDLRRVGALKKSAKKKKGKTKKGKTKKGKTKKGKTKKGKTKKGKKGKKSKKS